MISLFLELDGNCLETLQNIEEKAALGPLGNSEWHRLLQTVTAQLSPQTFTWRDCDCLINVPLRSIPVCVTDFITMVL